MVLRAAVIIGVLLFACGAALGWFAGTPFPGRTDRLSPSEIFDAPGAAVLWLMIASPLLGLLSRWRPLMGLLGLAGALVAALILLPAWFGGVRGTAYADGVAEDYAFGLFLSTAGSLLTVGASLGICALSFRRSPSRAARTFAWRG